MDNYPRLLVLASTFPRWVGDTEPAFVFALCKHLSQHYQVHVLAPHAPGAAVLETMDGITVHRFRYAPERMQTLSYQGGIISRLRQNRWRALLIPLFLLTEARAVRRLLRQYDFQAIHSHWIVPQTLALRLGTLGMRHVPPVLCTSHGGDLFGLQGRSAVALKRWALARCDAITVVSRAMVPPARALAPRLEPGVIPMGTDLTERFVPDPDSTRAPNQLLFVGRLVEKKGVLQLLEALARLVPKHPALRLTIAGMGPLQTQLEERAARADLQGHVEFLGGVPHDQLPQLFRRTTAAIVPSVVAEGGDQEGFGLVIVEAMGCACPVVVSDLPAIRDIVGEQDIARRVPPGDIDALANAIDHLLTDPEATQARAQRALAQVRSRFDWASISEAYRQTLESIGQAKRSGKA